MRRRSVQRQKIYECIRKTASHPTARDVYDRLKKETPSLSLGNTYRNIKILVEEGRVAAQKSGGVERYDAVTDSHYHFQCRECGCVNDFPMPFQKQITQRARALTEKIILGHAIQFSGICEACAGKNPTKTNRRRNP